MMESLLYKEEKTALGIDLLHITNKEINLVSLCCAIKANYKDLINTFVKSALDAGVCRDELLNVVSGLIKEGPALDSIIEFLRVLSYEENIRREPISVVDDWKED